MSQEVISRLLTRLLFCLACAAALTLFALVLGAPLHPLEPSPRWLDLFAQDSTVRRTALASGLGLFTTAFVFFRVPRRTPKPKKTRPPTSVGA